MISVILERYIKKYFGYPDVKFKKDTVIRIITDKYVELKNNRGIVKKYKNGLYYIFMVYPASYQLKEFDGEFIPEWFEENELEFYYKEDEREYNLNKILK
jgi:hypothetical protein